MNRSGTPIAPKAAAEELDGSCEILIVLSSGVFPGRGGSVILTELAEMAKPGAVWDTSRGGASVWCRLVRPREATAAAVSLGEGSVRRVARAKHIRVRRGSGISRTAVLLF